MALKDWKTTRKDNTHFVAFHKSKNLGLTAQISPEPFVNTFIFQAGNPKNAKIFKKNLTKSQALKFAKSYMRTH